jgi:type I restriction enzyme, S subunit
VPKGIDADTSAFFPSEFEESRLGPIPKGWQIKQIDDLASRVAMGPFGSRIKTDNFVPQGVPVIRGSNLTDGFNEFEFVYLTEGKADELKSSNAYPGDIVFTHRGTLGQVGFIPDKANYPRYVVSQSQMLVSVDKSQVSPRLIYRFFCSPQGQHALLRNVSQTGVPAIARPTTSLKAIPLVCPTKSLSNIFDQLTGPWDSKREINIKEIEFLVSIRDLLLPKLISGQLRIPEIEQIEGGIR